MFASSSARHGCRRQRAVLPKTVPPPPSVLVATTIVDRRNYPPRLHSKGKNTVARQKGKVDSRKGHIMADRTKIVVARVYPKPGRLQEVIDVYAGIVPLVYQEPGCELFALHTDGETVFA